MEILTSPVKQHSATYKHCDKYSKTYKTDTSPNYKV